MPQLGEVDLIASPPLAEARARFERSSRESFPGNESYLFGEAVLIPYANRIRGKALGGRPDSTPPCGRCTLAA